MTTIKPTTVRLSTETRRQIAELRARRGGDESGAAIIAAAVARMHWQTFEQAADVADVADASAVTADAVNNEAADA